MVEKIVVHFGEGGRSTVTVVPGQGVRGVLFAGDFDLPNVARTGNLALLNDRVRVSRNGEAVRFSDVEEQIGVCYWVEEGPRPELICW